MPLGFAAAIVVIWQAHPTVRSLVAGSLIAVTGESLRIWAAGHINKSREVTTSGPYRWIPHPLYAGSAIMAAGFALAARSLLVAAVIALYVGATIGAAIASEEAFLRGRFGHEYDRYRRGRGDRDAAGASRRFSLRRAIDNREYKAVAGLAAVIALLAWKAI